MLIVQVSRRLTRRIKKALYDRQLGFVKVAVHAYIYLIDKSVEEDSTYTFNYFNKELIHQPDAVVRLREAPEKPHGLAACPQQLRCIVLVCPPDPHPIDLPQHSSANPWSRPASSLHASPGNSPTHQASSTPRCAQPCTLAHPTNTARCICFHRLRHLPCWLHNFAFLLCSLLTWYCFVLPPNHSQTEVDHQADASTYLVEAVVKLPEAAKERAAGGDTACHMAASHSQHLAQLASLHTKGVQGGRGALRPRIRIGCLLFEGRFRTMCSCSHASTHT